ncbi:MAG: ankyrin repeat domain-containing protein [Pseudomonadota bacterium]
MNRVSTFVTNDGNWVITFDNYHAMGWGDNAILVYDRHGELRHSFGLTHFITDSEFADLNSTVSSLQWHCGDKHYRDSRFTLGFDLYNSGLACQLFALDLGSGEPERLDSIELPRSQWRHVSPERRAEIEQEDAETRASILEDIQSSPPLIRTIRSARRSALNEEVLVDPVSELQALLAKEHSVDATDKDGKTALQYATDLLYFADAAMLLVLNGADPHVGAGSMNHPFEKAIQRNDMALLRTMLELGINPNYPDGVEDSPVFAALWLRSEAAALLLLDYGVDVNRGNRRNTPLAWALRRERWNITDRLLAEGADTTKLDYHGTVRLAVYQGEISILRDILNSEKFPKGKRALSFIAETLGLAIRLNRPAVLKVLLEKGLDPDATFGVFKATALLEAVDYGAMECASILLEQGADANQADEYGFAPMDLALITGDEAMISLLAEYDAKAALGQNELAMSSEPE